ncbi:bifunctional purine biosynthesis protein PurH [Tepiditoga spiralis]|uniref:Bifunctional purine biosynthesis protein PurH n=1 Tax=Tepiditoga spiralis TaxID=2108365 RepID=A0A7G1GAN0_9BACT|nr:bifunctional phosphoribosylaminoimidazolecarboxamide formyltransferase/IMP cyclohydrolase [Tepiditoga spiralis]BBE31242.1 bifunctional purine biosynthesis protein PurH [Tepiditoga spiralis]
MKRALISTYYKDGIIEFSKFLESKGVEILSTGGTYKLLKENEIKVLKVSDITKFPEIMDGRVKTLHPKIHGGILARRGKDEKIMAELNIPQIDMVIVNLYPFFEKVNEGLKLEELIEFIDIGGPTMIRSAAKNFKDVVVITDNNDFELIEKELNDGEISQDTRLKLAAKAFNLTAAYDSAISEYLNNLTGNNFPKYHTISYEKKINLRYGENPHQSAAFYTKTIKNGIFNNFEQLNGKPLSYNNLRDADIAWKVVSSFEEIVCCGLKHNTPCGVAKGNNVYDAYVKAYECDPISIFGGIAASNTKIDAKTAKKMSEIFLEIIMAPEYDEDALEILKKKKNLRVLKMFSKANEKFEGVTVDGGILVQETDKELFNELKTVTETKINSDMMDDLIFAYKVVKFTKSNAIVVVKDGQAIGIGGGQVNRIWAAQQALERAGDGVILASDAFFPFDDVVKEAAKYNIKAIIQPGGSIRDKDSIKACNENKIAMVFTGMRHFKH